MLTWQVEDVREANLLEKRDKAIGVRESTVRGLAAAQMDAAQAKKMAAAAKRADSEAWKAEKERNQLAQVVRASVGKAAVSTHDGEPAPSARRLRAHAPSRRRAVMRDAQRNGRGRWREAAGGGCSIRRGVVAGSGWWEGGGNGVVGGARSAVEARGPRLSECVLDAAGCFLSRGRWRGGVCVWLRGAGGHNAPSPSMGPHP
jgi:hypothetical protein